ncbi:hypothetical protein Cenrod_1430 [Candidatus Symbiobacter mobilis CR]|uniref:Uncharacterized protein n=1 Tax=Candidatus Symbiobacter mobilis CR TaxID=946483 RepID=U5N7Z5_9BURK|nr:hypothetical protein Cenrod_1430 [Candidatus Symbiobacter mobilis CR]
MKGTVRIPGTHCFLRAHPFQRWYGWHPTGPQQISVGTDTPVSWASSGTDALLGVLLDVHRPRFLTGQGDNWTYIAQ